MNKLAFAFAGNFEMPKVETVGLEKESNLVFAGEGVTVYKGGATGFSKSQMMRTLTQAETEQTNEVVSA